MVITMYLSMGWGAKIHTNLGNVLSIYRCMVSASNAHVIENENTLITRIQYTWWNMNAYNALCWKLGITTCINDSKAVRIHSRAFVWLLWFMQRTRQITQNMVSCIQTIKQARSTEWIALHNVAHHIDVNHLHQRSSFTVHHLHIIYHV